MRQFLAMLAVLFLLFRPLCEVQAAEFAHDEPGAQTHATASGHAGDTVPCCDELEDGTLIAPSAPALALGADDGKSAFPRPALDLPRDGRRSGALASYPPDVPPSHPSFYARTARIRR